MPDLLPPGDACLLIAADTESVNELVRTRTWPHWLVLEPEMLKIRTLVFYDCSASVLRVIATVAEWDQNRCTYRPELTCVDELVDPVEPAFDGWSALGEGICGDRSKPGVLLWHEAHPQRLGRVLRMDEAAIQALVLARGIRQGAENREHPCWPRRVMLAQGWGVPPCERVDCPMRHGVPCVTP